MDRIDLLSTCALHKFVCISTTCACNNYNNFPGHRHASVPSAEMQQSKEYAFEVNSMLP